MKILIVAATEIEVEPLHKALKTSFPQFLNSAAPEFLITGIGMVATAYALGKELASDKYGLILNAGIAGSYNRNINIGDVVNVMSDTIYEMGAEDGNNFIPFHKLGIEKLSETNMNDNIIINKTHIENETITKLLKVNGITVNTIHGNEESIKKIIQNYNPEIETMEGAAFMFACTHANLPYCQIRSISNYVEKRNTNNWNIKLAIENLNKTLMEIIKSYQ